MAGPLRVGIVGVSVERGWAKESHVPAVQHLRGLELAAVAAGSQANADAAARAFGASAAFGNASEMIRSPDIDLVAVCIKAPDHRELVLGALAAGKHVYCEWPLGANTAEAEQMRSAAQTAAQAAGIHVAIGLQTRGNPAARRARDLIAANAIGRPLTAHVCSSTIGFGNKTSAAESYTEKPENGVNLVTIQGAHTIDLSIYLLGALADLSALTTTQYPRVTIGDDAVAQTRSTPDHLLVQARLASGAALSVEVAGGRPPETPFHLEVVGDKGVLTLTGGAPRGFQAGRLQLSLNGEPQSVDEGELAFLPDTAANVAGMYVALRDDIERRTSTTPGFDYAVRLATLIDDVLSSATSGSRKQAKSWPE